MRSRATPSRPPEQYRNSWRNWRQQIELSVQRVRLRWVRGCVRNPARISPIMVQQYSSADPTGTLRSCSFFFLPDVVSFFFWTCLSVTTAETRTAEDATKIPPSRAKGPLHGYEDTKTIFKNPQFPPGPSPEAAWAGAFPPRDREQHATEGAEIQRTVARAASRRRLCAPRDRDSAAEPQIFLDSGPRWLRIPAERTGCRSADLSSVHREFWVEAG